MKLVFAGRKFQLWEYRVSHGQLLIRSPKDAEHPTNVDLIFSGVEFLESPRHLPDLEVVDAGERELARASDALGRSLPAESVFVLQSRRKRHLVVAAGLRSTESVGEIFDSPFASPTRPET